VCIFTADIIYHLLVHNLHDVITCVLMCFCLLPLLAAECNVRIFTADIIDPPFDQLTQVVSSL
jgi:hypothetical protein